MKQFAIQGAGSSPSLLQLLSETDNGYYVRIVYHHDDWEDVKEDFMSRDLFNTCLRTGYIAEVSA